MDKETSSRVSTIASNILGMEPVDEHSMSNRAPAFNNLLEQAKVLAGSALSQDETPGQQPKNMMDGISEIYPAPPEFSTAQITVDPILHFFHYAHLPPKLQATSRLFFILAAAMVNTLPRNPERTVALRKLLEAKDAAVRANLPAPRDFRTNKPPASEWGGEFEQPIGEPVLSGGYGDGPIPFDG